MVAVPVHADPVPPVELCQADGDPGVRLYLNGNWTTCVAVHPTDDTGMPCTDGNGTPGVIVPAIGAQPKSCFTASAGLCESGVEVRVWVLPPLCLTGQKVVDVTFAVLCLVDPNLPPC